MPPKSRWYDERIKNSALFLNYFICRKRQTKGRAGFLHWRNKDCGPESGENAVPCDGVA
jgi:hypothetical protein